MPKIVYKNYKPPSTSIPSLVQKPKKSWTQKYQNFWTRYDYPSRLFSKIPGLRKSLRVKDWKKKKEILDIERAQEKEEAQQIYYRPDQVQKIKQMLEGTLNETTQQKTGALNIQSIKDYLLTILKKNSSDNKKLNRISERVKELIDENKYQLTDEMKQIPNLHKVIARAILSNMIHNKKKSTLRNNGTNNNHVRQMTFFKSNVSGLPTTTYTL